MVDRPSASAKKVFAEGTFRTHMPFFDGKQLLYCRAGDPINRDFESAGTIWKTLRSNPHLQKRFATLERSRRGTFCAWNLYRKQATGGESQRVPTGLPEDAIECSPAFFTESGTLHVSFIGGVVGPQRITYRLYEMTGASWSQLASAVPALAVETTVGFVSPLYRCFQSRDALVLQDRHSSSTIRLTSPFTIVQRVSYRSDAPEQILITGSSPGNTPQTLLYDVKRNITQEVRTSGPVYKPSLYGDTVYHAQSRESRGEQYELWRDGVMLAPTNMAVSAAFSSPQQ